MSRRPSHDLLMEAQQKLGAARDAETAAGNRGVAMVLNDLTLLIFKIAIDPDIDHAEIFGPRPGDDDHA